MKIKQVEELVGITRKNIRFYEEQGLLNVAACRKRIQGISSGRCHSASGNQTVPQDGYFHRRNESFSSKKRKACRSASNSI